MDSKTKAFGCYGLGKVLGATAGGTAWECLDPAEERNGILWIEGISGSRATQFHGISELHAQVASAFPDGVVARLEVGRRGGKAHIAVLFPAAVSDADLVGSWARLRERIPDLTVAAEPRLPGSPTVQLPAAPAAEAALSEALQTLPRRCGQYELIEEVGRGGMGVVCRARHPGLDKIVALKIIQVGPATPEEVVQRFLREARLVASLHHPNIVVVHDVGADGPNLYFAMDFLEGTTMSDWLASGPAIPDVLRVMERICRALHHAHEAGVVHRDLKPTNVILLAGLNPVVTDFGLAKNVAADESGTGLTQSGRVFGTPAYMAPEQASGKQREIGPRTDVYSLGVMLYEAVTGKPPFQADNVNELLFRVVIEDPPPPRALVPLLSNDLEEVILKAMARNPERRYPTAAALADDLARLLAEEKSRAQA